MQQRVLRAALAALAVLTCWTSLALPACAQTEAESVRADATPVEFEKVFGTAGQDGFRVGFTRFGASITYVNLLGHRAASIHDDENRQDDYLLADVLWRTPGYPEDGFYPSLAVGEWHAKSWLTKTTNPKIAAWSVVENVDNRVVFSLDLGSGLTITKAFEYEPPRSDLRIVLGLNATDEHPNAGSRASLRLHGLAVRSPQSEYLFNTSSARAMGAIQLDDGQREFRSLTAQAGSESDSRIIASASAESRIVFAGSTNRFFAAFLYPVDDVATNGLWTAAVEPMPAVAQGDMPAGSLPVVSYGIRLDVPRAGESVEAAFRLYLGPKSNRVYDEFARSGLDEYADRFEDVVYEDLQPVGCFCPIPFAQDMANILLWLLGWFYDFVGNWGVAIMLLTILVRGALVPLNFRMQKSMRAYGAKAAKLKPKLEEIQKKYANDKKQLQQHMLAFQREHKMFPPVGGCLPMFVTIPVFIGMFTALRTSYELRQQPFILWIDDLSQPDALFELGMDWAPHFNLLPILMVGLWWFLQSGTPLPSDPQQRQMMKIMRFMPLMFGVMLYSYASGLMVYMITSSLFAIVEQRVTKKILGPISAEAAAFGTPQI